MSNYRVIYHDAMNDDDYLEHHGILGMKWGVRRYQNPDGTLTEEGKKRYYYSKVYNGYRKMDKSQKEAMDIDNLDSEYPGFKKWSLDRGLDKDWEYTKVISEYLQNFIKDKKKEAENAKRLDEEKKISKNDDKLKPKKYTATELIKMMNSIDGGNSKLSDYGEFGGKTGTNNDHLMDSLDARLMYILDSIPGGTERYEVLYDYNYGGEPEIEIREKKTIKHSDTSAKKGDSKMSNYRVIYHDDFLAHYREKQEAAAVAKKKRRIPKMEPDMAMVVTDEKGNIIQRPAYIVKPLNFAGKHSVKNMSSVPAKYRMNPKLREEIQKELRITDDQMNYVELGVVQKKHQREAEARWNKPVKLSKEKMQKDKEVGKDYQDKELSRRNTKLAADMSINRDYETIKGLVEYDLKDYIAYTGNIPTSKINMLRARVNEIKKINAGLDKSIQNKYPDIDWESSLHPARKEIRSQSEYDEFVKKAKQYGLPISGVRFAKGFRSNTAKHDDFLAHHGIHGQKWGIRRFQNPDGTLTEAGKKRYRTSSNNPEDIDDYYGLKNREKDVKKSIRLNQKARGKEHSKIANNPENFLGLNKKHANKIDEYTKNIDAGKEEVEKIFAKIEAIKDADLNRAIDDFIDRWNENAQKGQITYQAVGKQYTVKDNKAKTPDNKPIDGADIDRKAHAAAKKAGLDQGDNWKVYRNAQAGDEEAKRIIREWEKKKNG